MGFWSRLFGKEKYTEEHPKEDAVRSSEGKMSIGDAEMAVKEVHDRYLKEFAEEMGVYHENIRKTLDSFKASLDSLEKAAPNQPDTPMNPMYMQKILAMRKSFLSKTRVMARQLEEPLGEDIDSIMGYKSSTMSMVEKIDKNSLREFASFKGMFKKESDAVSKNFKNLFENVKALAKAVDGGMGRFDSIKSASSQLESLKRSLKAVAESREEREVLEVRTAELGSRLKLEEERLGNIVSSTEWKTFIDMSEERKMLESQEEEIRFLLSQSFAAIERPLRKFRNIIEHGSSKEEMKIVDRLLESGIDAILAMDSLEGFRYIMQGIYGSISSGKLEVKEKNKTLGKMRTMMDSDVFEGLKGRHDDVSKRLAELNDRMKTQKIGVEKERIEREVERIKSEIEMAPENISETDRDIERLKSSVESKKAELESSLSSLTGEKVSIELNM